MPNLSVARPEVVPTVRAVTIDRALIERLAVAGCGLVIRPCLDGEDFTLRVEAHSEDDSAGPLPGSLRPFDPGNP